MHDREPTTGSQSIDRATNLLAMIASHHRTGVTLATLIAECGLNQATVRRILEALSRAALIEQNPNSRLYFLGSGSYILGALASDRFGLHPLTHESVTRLALKSEDTAFFSLRRGNYATCLFREDGKHPIRSHVLDVGQFHPLGVAAHGIAMLAALPDEEMNAVIEANKEDYRQKYPMLTETLLRDIIESTRERGWALNQGIFHAGAWAVGVVVRGVNGEVAGGLSIGAIEQRLNSARQEELAKMLLEEADKIEKNLVAMTPGKGVQKHLKKNNLIMNQ
ncbi:MAG: IclR family transcriptional regulator [Alphaproteobacteria bacterium]|nr:IclR family transcriptional regulator [Alphaproteobacteria bacterium]